MPKPTDFIVKYDFLGIDEAAGYETRTFEQSQFNNNNELVAGYIELELDTLSPIYIGGGINDKGFETSGTFQLDDKLAIPASSFKGAFSSVMEAILNSNYRVFYPRTTSGKANLGTYTKCLKQYINGKYDTWEYRKEKFKDLSIPDYLFGGLRPVDGLALSGRLRFSNIFFDNSSKSPKEFPIGGSYSPKPKTIKKYWEDNKISGRKFYYPEKTYSSNKSTNNNPVVRKHAIEKFSKSNVFKLYFEDISYYDLSCVMSTIAPNKEFKHQVGGMKSSGYGWCKLTPIAIYIKDKASYNLSKCFSSGYKLFDQNTLPSLATSILNNITSLQHIRANVVKSKKDFIDPKKQELTQAQQQTQKVFYIDDILNISKNTQDTITEIDLEKISVFHQSFLRKSNLINKIYVKEKFHPTIDEHSLDKVITYLQFILDLYSDKLIGAPKKAQKNVDFHTDLIDKIKTDFS